MSDAPFYVCYTVDMGNRREEMQAGPYETQEIAEGHQRDIGGYAAVSQVWLTNVRYADRRLTSS